MRARAFIVPKEAETEADCQDRFSINPVTGSVAVSDGMSQSLFPKYWAEILAEQYTSERDWFPSRENVRALTPLWKERVDARLEAWKELGREQWRAQEMLANGASAGSTLVGLRIGRASWTCDVLGDSCLVVLEGSRIKDIHSSMDHFDNYPEYYDSNPDNPGKGEVKTIKGRFNPPESPATTLLLVTDALGAFLSSIKGTSREKTYIRELLNVESADEFKILIEYWRKDGMHNDDTTLVIVNDDYWWMGKSTTIPNPGDCFKRQEEWVW